MITPPPRTTSVRAAMVLQTAFGSCSLEKSNRDARERRPSPNQRLTCGDFSEKIVISGLNWSTEVGCYWGMSASAQGMK
jgi:hypothetical protein